VAFEVLNLAFKAPITPVGKKSVLVAMADWASADGTGVYPGARALSDKTGLSERWVRELRRQLRDEDGLIIMTKPATYNRPAEYRIDLDALRRLIDGAEASSPPEPTSPPPLNSVPRPPELITPKPPTEPSIEPPQGEVEAQIDAEVRQIISEKINRGESITNQSAFEAGVRRKVEAKVTERIETQEATAAGLNIIASCVLCNSSGIAAWEAASGRPQSERCTHRSRDYRDRELITRQDDLPADH
jgi:hypothetical protein